MITQKQIAEILGISRTTVARAINGDKYVREETRKKVLELVQEKNYQKNFVGSSLASKKKNIFAFIVKSKNLYYTNQIKNGLLKIKKDYECYNLKLNIIITDINSPDEQARKLKEILTTKNNVDGIIIIPLNSQKISSILKPYLKKMKIVSMSKKLDENISHVGPNNFKQGEITAGVLAKLLNKNEKILVLDGGDDNISSKNSLEGFLKNIKKYSVEIIGPIKIKSIKDALSTIEKVDRDIDISSIYVNRYAQDIFKEISKEKLINKKIVTNGIGKRIRKLIEDGYIIATITDDSYETGYLAGKIMFDMIYKEKNKYQNITAESKIIFFENL